MKLIPKASAERFTCEWYEADIKGQTCIERQQSDPSGEWKHCTGGKCQQGQRVAASLGEQIKRARVQATTPTKPPPRPIPTPKRDVGEVPSATAAELAPVKPDSRPEPSARQELLDETTEPLKVELGFTPPIDIPVTPKARTFKSVPGATHDEAFQCGTCGKHLNDHQGEGLDWEQWLCPSDEPKPAPAESTPAEPKPSAPAPAADLDEQAAERAAAVEASRRNQVARKPKPTPPKPLPSEPKKPLMHTCFLCKTRELRSNNTTGICLDCRTAFGNPTPQRLAKLKAQAAKHDGPFKPEHEQDKGGPGPKARASRPQLKTTPPSKRAVITVPTPVFNPAYLTIKELVMCVVELRQRRKEIDEAIATLETSHG